MDRLKTYLANPLAAGEIFTNQNWGTITSAIDALAGFADGLVAGMMAPQPPLSGNVRFRSLFKRRHRSLPSFRAIAPNEAKSAQSGQ